MHYPCHLEPLEFNRSKKVIGQPLPLGVPCSIPSLHLFLSSFGSSLLTRGSLASTFIIIFFFPVVVDGGWSTWSSWNTCSKSCGTGQQERRRSCTKPSPSNGGKTCVGLTREDRACNTLNCPGEILRSLTSFFVLRTILFVFFCWVRVIKWIKVSVSWGPLTLFHRSTYRLNQ